MKSYSAWQRDELFQALGPLMLQFRDDLYDAAIKAAVAELQDQRDRKDQALAWQQEVIDVERLEQTARAATDAMREAERKISRQWAKFDKYIEKKSMSGYVNRGDITLRDALRQLMEETRKEVTDRVIREIQAAIRSQQPVIKDQYDDLKRKREAAEKQIQHASMCVEKYVTPRQKRLKEELMDYSLEMSEEF